MGIVTIHVAYVANSDRKKQGFNLTAPMCEHEKDKKRGPENRASVKFQIKKGESITVATTTTAAATATATTAAAATAAAAKFTTTATAAARTLFARARNVNSERASIQLLAVHGFNGFLRLVRRTHGDECEAARAAAHTVHHQVGFDDRAVGSKCVLEVVLSGVEGKISNKQFRTHVMSYCPKLTLALSRLFPTAGFQSSLNRVHLKISMPWN